MKTRKVFSTAIAAVMALAALPVLPAGAAGAMMGDLDGDGHITGHDTAMLSRAMYDNTYQLSEDQLFLADMDNNGTVTRDDLESLHAKEEFALGSFQIASDQESGIVRADCPTVDASYTALMLSTLEALDYDIHKCSDTEYPEAGKGMPFYVDKTDGKRDVYVIEKVWNLCDADLDGKLLLTDAYIFLMSNASVSLGLSSMYFQDTRYELDILLLETEIKMPSDFELKHEGMTFDEYFQYMAEKLNLQGIQ